MNPSICSCLDPDVAYQMMIGFTLVGWIAGIVMYKAGQVWKARLG